jgi:uncharacterized protein (DUF58 family)
MFRWILAVAGVVSLAMLVGCGETFTPPPGVIVKGKLVQGGAPVTVAPTPDNYNGPMLQFFAADPTEALAETTAYTDASGNFTVDYAGEGIPPGKYKIAVIIQQGHPGGQAGARSDPD